MGIKVFERCMLGLYNELACNVRSSENCTISKKRLEIHQVAEWYDMDDMSSRRDKSFKLYI